MNENLIAEIEKTFAETSELKNVKTTPCRISFKGQFVTLASGKTIRDLNQSLMDLLFQDQCQHQFQNQCVLQRLVDLV